MAETRHADKETLDHIIDLRIRLQQAEHERDNALAYLTAWTKERRELREKLKKLGALEEEERNC